MSSRIRGFFFPYLGSSGAGEDDPASDLRSSGLCRQLCEQMNEKFMEITQTMTEEGMTDVCVQVLALFKKLQAPGMSSTSPQAIQRTLMEVAKINDDQGAIKGTRSASSARPETRIPSIRPSSEVRGFIELSNASVKIRNDQRAIKGSRSAGSARPGTRNPSIRPSSEVRGSIKLGNASGEDRLSNRVHPAPAVQSSFDKAMRARIAELVESTHEKIGLAKDQRPASQKVSINGHYTNRSLWHLLFSSTTEEGMYDVFLNFRDPAYQSAENRSDYLSFKRSDGNIPLQNFVLVICFIYVATRFWFADGAEKYAKNPMALVAILFAVLTALMSISTLFLRLSYFSVKYNIRMLQRFHPATVRFYNSRFGQCLDDGTVIGAALTAGLYMVSRALAPACPPGTTATMLHRDAVCNPAGTIPSEVMAFALVIVIAFQMLARGVSRLGLVCAWVIMIVTINVSMGLVGSCDYFWINGELAYLIALSYELERLPLRQFIKSVRVVQASEVNALLKVALSKYQVRESQQALEAKRSMVRHIGHEIRTPLNIIGVGTEVLLKELKQLKRVIPRNIVEVVEGIEDASTAALEVVNELLMFEKLAAGMTTIEAVPTYIVRFLQKAMRQHMLPALAKEIDFKLSVEARDKGKDMGVNIDPIKMTVVFRNIFSNAIKFTGKGSTIEVCVTFKVSAVGQELVLIACKDQGAGLSKANLQLLFGEGVQFNANKLQNGGGSGLGLFITKGIVMLHEGANIWAESEGEGKGCTFFVELPLVKITQAIESESDSDDDDSSDSSSVADEKRDVNNEIFTCPAVGEVVSARRDSKSPGPVAALAPFKPRVLIVDDSLMNRRMLARMLEAEGFVCSQAVDGLAAVAVVNRVLMHRRPAFPVVPKTSSNGSRLPAGGGPSDEARRADSRRQLANTSLSTPRSIHEHTPDVILMDSNMPKMNGPDAVTEIRKMGFKFPIFGVTGDEDHASFMRAGATGVMMKPVRAAELVKSIKLALGKAVAQTVLDRSCKPAATTPRLPSAMGFLSVRERGLSAAWAVTADVDADHLVNMDVWLLAQAQAQGQGQGHAESTRK